MTYVIDNIRHNVIEKITSITDDYAYVYPELFEIPTYNSGKGKLLLNGKTYVDGSMIFLRAHAEQKKGLLIVTERYRMYQYERLLECLKLAVGDFDIVVIHQNNDNLFNKAMLINIAFLECNNYDYDYIIIHDIDMFSNIRYDLNYTGSFVQFCGSLNGYGKTRRSLSCISGKPFHGGITIINSDVFRKINGMDNRYSGWGYEDTDLIKRLTLAGYVGTVRYSEFDCPENSSDRSNYSENSTLISKISDYHAHGLSNLTKKPNNQNNQNNPNKAYEYEVVHSMTVKDTRDTRNIRHLFVHFIDHKDTIMNDYSNRYRDKYIEYINTGNVHAESFFSLSTTTANANITSNNSNFFKPIHIYTDKLDRYKSCYTALKLFSNEGICENLTLEPDIFLSCNDKTKYAYYYQKYAREMFLSDKDFILKNDIVLDKTVYDLSNFIKRQGGYGGQHVPQQEQRQGGYGGQHVPQQEQRQGGYG